MAKVQVRIKRTGRVKTCSARDGRVLVLSGVAEYYEAPKPKARPESPDLGALSYWDLRKLAVERGIVPDGQKKADYLRALRYGTRAMRAD